MRLNILKSGKWYRLDLDGVVYVACCGCGLTHKEKYEKRGKWIYMKVARHERLTAHFRKLYRKRYRKELKELIHGR